MTNIPFFDLTAAHHEIRDRMASAMAGVVERSHLILGPETEAFEAEFAAFCGAKHCIGVGNGLDALKIILQALGVGPRDEVIVPAHTFIATWLAVAELGARIVAVDVDPASCNMDPSLVEAAITSRTKAIMPVHLYGRLADMAAIQAIAAPRGIHVVEDSAQAHGASDAGGTRAGNFGIAAGFSFYPSKNLGALGDGGAIVTNDEDMAKKTRLLRNYGSGVKYYYDMKGMNSRLDELQSAFLRIKLEALEAKNRTRDQLAARYIEHLPGLQALHLPERPADTTQVWHLFVPQTRDRERFIGFLKERGVATLIHYPVACHLQPAFADAGYKRGHFPVTERLAEEVVSLPLWPEMSEAQQDRVIEVIREWDQAMARAA
jgi:dTDP-3-amino-3,4,6-trideoxy-alpha-D-glucose transaminase